ncbi:unnamed protein product, partial [Leptidea sinapis]
MESPGRMNQAMPTKYHRQEANYRSCSQSLPLDILWLPRSAFRHADGELADCVLVVGVSRPKLAAALLSAASMASAASESRKMLQNQESSRTINHPMMLRKRLKTPRTPRPTRRLPQALIVGVRKCGTRALLEMLYLHPMVQKASGEVHFFDRDENYALGLEWYRSKMPLSFKGQITIEKSPSYFVTPEAHCNIALSRLLTPMVGGVPEGTDFSRRKNFYFNETKGFYCLRNDTTDKCLRETKGRKHPRVDPAVVTKLRKFFIQHNQRFYDL